MSDGKPPSIEDSCNTSKLTGSASKSSGGVLLWDKETSLDGDSVVCSLRHNLQYLLLAINANHCRLGRV